MSILLLIVWNQLSKYCIQIWLHHGITSILINIPLSIVGNPYLDKKYDVYFVNHLIQVGIIMFWNVVFFPENCVWGPWSNWLSCSKTCGGGTETRSRTKTKTKQNGGNCSESGSESKTCNTQSCPGKQATIFLDL